MPPSDAASAPSRSVVNDWLIAEMEARFHADPSSVSADWQALFTSPAHRNGAANGDGAAATSRGLPPAVAAIDPDGPEPRRLRGTSARIVENMEDRKSTR